MLRGCCLFSVYRTSGISMTQMKKGVAGIVLVSCQASQTGVEGLQLVMEAARTAAAASAATSAAAGGGGEGDAGAAQDEAQPPAESEAAVDDAAKTQSQDPSAGGGGGGTAAASHPDHDGAAFATQAAKAAALRSAEIRPGELVMAVPRQHDVPDVNGDGA